MVMIPTGWNASLPPDVDIRDRYTPDAWLRLLEPQFHPQTWREGVLAYLISCQWVTYSEKSQVLCVRVREVQR